MKKNWKVILASLVPLAILIVIVTQVARTLGDPTSAVVPPLFAIGGAVICGKIIRRKLQQENGRETK
ncbi:hypothetical protein [Streptomyces sp. ATCC 21386]|uniref:hypothetical protein n=1 Tax=Streptomyces sp. ATCC 21386 TaxID=2699428 RepID=UPI001BFF85F1|nr:hypothetical protein [Streptomyces sp. ATCC 21386]